MRYENWQKRILLKQSLRKQKQHYQEIILAVCFLLIILHVILPQEIKYSDAILEPQCSLLAIFRYQLHHANLFHLLANLWCFLTLFFVWDLKVKDLAEAYFVTILYGSIFLFLPTSVDLHILGLSSFTYALAGQHSVKASASYTGTILITILITTFIPHVSCVTHLACFLLAILIRNIKNIFKI